jgi:hypothetical protein
VEEHYGRRSWHRLHLVDLADGSRRTLPGHDDDERAPVVAAVHGGAVYLTFGSGTGLLRWVPGSDPQPQPIRWRQLDPLSGVMLAQGDGAETLVLQPGGAGRRLVIDLGASLAPGGKRLYTYRYDPPAMTLFDVATGADRPQVYWLPPGVRVVAGRPWAPVWEDEHHVLFTMDGRSRELDAAALRLDVRSGELERVPLTPDAGHRPMLVQPLLRRP